MPSYSDKSLRVHLFSARPFCSINMYRTATSSAMYSVPTVAIFLMRLPNRSARQLDASSLHLDQHGPINCTRHLGCFHLVGPMRTRALRSRILG